MLRRLGDKLPVETEGPILPSNRQVRQHVELKDGIIPDLITATREDAGNGIEIGVDNQVCSRLAFIFQISEDFKYRQISVESN